MIDRLNLELDFENLRTEPDGRGLPAVGRVYVATAASYLKSNGAPVISKNCQDAALLKAECERLKAELDSIVEEAEARFSTSASGTNATSPAADASHPASSSKKKPLALRNGLLVKDRMTREVRTIHRNDRLSIADELMKVGRFRHLVVMDDEDREVVGVLSQRALLFSALDWVMGQGKRAQERALQTVIVKEVMDTSVVEIRPGAGLAEAASTMLEKKIDCLTVMEDDRLVGILTEGDFLAMLSDAQFDGEPSLEER